MELKASEFGVVLSVDALKLSRQSPLGIGIGGGGVKNAIDRGELLPVLHMRLGGAGRAGGEKEQA